MNRAIILLVVLAAGVAGTSEAGADRPQHRYVGIHPIPAKQGGGLCHIEAPHVHVYGIEAKVQYRDHDGWSHFVGDPVAYGWDGPKHAYYGHHPVPVHVVVGDDHDDTEYCYLDGPHYHAWAPPPGLDLELRGGAYWYVGQFPRAYVDGRRAYGPIDVVYEPIHYTRPVIEVAVAPPQWYGLVVAPAAVVVPPPRPVRAGVEVVVPAPTLRVEVAVPSIVVGVGGGVVVHDHGHRYKVKHKHRRGRGHRHDD